MDFVVSLMIEFNGSNYVFSVSHNTTFDDILFAMCGKWRKLDVNCITLRYVVAGFDNCLLESNIDVKSMLILAQQLGVKIIKCLVVDDRALNQTTANAFDNSIQNTTVGATNLYKNGKNNGDEFQKSSIYPMYDVCSLQEEKSLLSDQWETIITGIGQQFLGGASDFRKQLIKYSTIQGFSYNYNQNNKRRIYVVCKKRLQTYDCKWFIRASEVIGGMGEFIITQADLVHTCEVVVGAHETERFRAPLLATLIEGDVRDNPKMGGTDIRRLIKKSYGIDITYKQAWRALENSRDKIFGSFQDSFENLRWYLEALQKTNPGSVVKLEQNADSNRFERAFIAFKATIDGFKYCRPMLFIDGTFMRGRWKGTILSATAKDGNNGLFPVAFAMVQGETTLNWKWFLQLLRDNVKHAKPVYYISDRNTGLLSAFPEVWEKPLNFYCLFHLFKNLKAQYGHGFNESYRIKMCSLLKRCAYAPTPRLFKIEMAEFIKEGGSLAKNWICTIEPDKWSVAYAPHILRYGEMTSNAAESFNHWIKDARALPITFMVDYIRLGIMRWFVERRDAAAKWTSKLTEAMQKIWNSGAHICKHWGVLKCPSGRYEVFSIPNAEVDIGSKTCSCYQWQVTGFPCVHAIVVIIKHYTGISGIVHDYYLKLTYTAAYAANIHSIPETEKFEFQNKAGLNKILPPEKLVEFGRPKRKRIPSFGEFPAKKKWFCKKCNQIGRHDEVTCSLSS